MFRVWSFESGVNNYLSGSKVQKFKVQGGEGTLNVELLNLELLESEVGAKRCR
jgi:hypothetical protein